MARVLGKSVLVLHDEDLTCDFLSQLLTQLNRDDWEFALSFNILFASQFCYHINDCLINFDVKKIYSWKLFYVCINKWQVNSWKESFIFSENPNDLKHEFSFHLIICHVSLVMWSFTFKSFTSVYSICVQTSSIALYNGCSPENPFWDSTKIYI